MLLLIGPLQKLFHIKSDKLLVVQRLRLKGNWKGKIDVATCCLLLSSKQHHHPRERQRGISVDPMLFWLGCKQREGREEGRKEMGKECYLFSALAGLILHVVTSGFTLPRGGKTTKQKKRRIFSVPSSAILRKRTYFPIAATPKSNTVK